MQYNAKNGDSLKEFFPSVKTSLTKGMGIDKALLPLGNALICSRLAIESHATIPVSWLSRDRMEQPVLNGTN